MPMSVQVVTPDREVLVTDEATFVYAHGIDGDVGILPGHAPLMIALGAGPLRIDSGDRQQWMIADGGFLQVSENLVIILGEYLALPNEVDLEAVRREVADLQGRLGTAADPERDDLQRRLDRANGILHSMERIAPVRT